MRSPTTRLWQKRLRRRLSHRPVPPLLQGWHPARLLALRPLLHLRLRPLGVRILHLPVLVGEPLLLRVPLRTNSLQRQQTPLRLSLKMWLRKPLRILLLRLPARQHPALSHAP